MTKEQLIRARIRTENGIATVCADDYLSMAVKKSMLEKPWVMPEDPDELNTLPSDPCFAGRQIQQEIPAQDWEGAFDCPEYTLPPRMNFQEDMEEAADSKDIMDKLPKKTKFRFLKRVLNRILRLTNRYQQRFNNAVFRILIVLTGTLGWIRDALIMTDDKANRAIKKSDLQARELSRQKRTLEELRQNYERFVQETIQAAAQQHSAEIAEIVEQQRKAEEQFSQYKTSFQLQNERLQLQNERLQLQNEQITWYREQLMQQQQSLSVLKNNVDDMNRTFDQQNSRMAVAETDLTGLRNTSSYCTETLGAQNFRIDQVEKKLEQLQNQASYNSEQLGNQNFRLESLARKTERMQYETGRAKKAGSEAEVCAQSGEDVIVDYILQRFNVRPSEVSYLDLGANHAKYLSNTYFFYCRSAHGVLVEANPDLIPELKAMREGDIILNKGVAPKSGDMLRFYVANKDGLSSSSKDSMEEIIQQSSEVQIEKLVEVETVSVNDLFSRYFHPVPTFVSMDLEGIELDILRSIDFDNYRPLIYIIETIPFRSHLVANEKENDIVEFMREKGYTEYAFTGINSIFLDTRRIEMCG